MDVDRYGRDQRSLGSEKRAHDDEKKGFLMDDEDLYDLFVDEAIRQGVRLESEEAFMDLVAQIHSKEGRETTDSQIMVRVAVDLVKEREASFRPKEPMSKLARPELLIDKSKVTPAAKVEPTQVPPDGVGLRSEPLKEDFSPSAASHRTPAVEEKILKKLGWSSNDAAAMDRVDVLIERIRAAGISDPHSFISLKEACERTDIAERTLRRYIAEGLLPTEKVRGPRGPEHRVYVPRLFLVLLERSAAFERARSSPLEDMSREIAALCRAIVDQQSEADRRVDRLLDEMRNQGRMIDDLRAEQRDARAQMHTLQEHMIKALLPPERPKPFLRRLFEWR
jgi:DNA-binding transcriptional MerR regulator